MTMLSDTEEAALAIAVEAGVLAEEAARGRFPVEASEDELDALVEAGRAARDRLLLENEGLVRTIVRGESTLAPADSAELLQEGRLAMAEALARFDHRRGRFGPYAAAWIRARVRCAVTTQCGRLPVPARELSRYYAARRTETELMQSLGRSLLADEVPGGTHTDRVRAFLFPEPASRAASIAVPEPVEAAATEAAELLDLLPSWERRVVRRRFGFDGPPATRAMLAVELGVSEPTVRRLELRALETLRTELARLAA